MEEEREDTRPVLVAGWQDTGRVVMRNGIEGNRSRNEDDTADLAEEVKSADGALNQRLEALERANLVRCDRAEYRRKLEQGLLHFDEFLDETPPCCSQVQVVKALTWVPDIGRVKAVAIVRELADADLDVKLGELTPKDKYKLSFLVEGIAYRRKPAPAIAA